MKTKITIFLFGTAIFLFVNNIARAQSSSALNSYNGAYYLGWSSANDLPFIINGSTYMTLKSTTGYFGLGTTSPLGKLDVLGGNGAASWAYIRGNVAGTKPSTASTGGLGIGYNYTNAQGEVDFVCNRADLGGTSGFRFQDWETTGAGTITDLVTILGGGAGSNTGNTGIGTTTPASKLDVEGGIAVGVNYSGTTAAPANGAIIEGNVGIGTATPTFLLDVRKNQAGYTLINVDNSNTAATGTGEGYSISESGVTTAVLRVERDGSGTMNLINTAGPINIKTGATIAGATSKMTILTGGNVGIGTTSPAYTLDVCGDIRATGSVYYGGTCGTANGTAYTKPDYVFGPEYKFYTTTEVKEFIYRKGHLPWLTSAKDDKKENNGAVNMTRMTFETLEAAENIQMQIIEQQKTIDSLTTKTTTRDSINTSLEKQVNQLTIKTNNQDSVNTSLQNQLTINNTLFQNKLDELLTTISNCCNLSILSPTINNQENKTITVPEEGETTQLNVELNNTQTIVLQQNLPNPFAEQTSISYYLPDNVGKAQILFYNAKGILIQSTELIQKGKGTLNVFASDLSNGIYTYTLVVDGKIIETKKMVKQ